MNSNDPIILSEQWGYAIESDGALQLYRERWYRAAERNRKPQQYRHVEHDVYFGRRSWYTRVAGRIWVKLDDDKVRITEDVNTHVMRSKP
jgi:hypothetical protein